MCASSGTRTGLEDSTGVTELAEFVGNRQPGEAGAKDDNAHTAHLAAQFEGCLRRWDSDEAETGHCLGREAAAADDSDALQKLPSGAHRGRECSWFLGMFIGVSKSTRVGSGRFAVGIVQSFGGDQRHSRDWPGAATITQALREHGVHPDTPVTVLSDGDAGLRAIQRAAAPEADPVLDWFHIAMRWQHVHQLATGAIHQGQTAEARTWLLDRIERAKWALWNGQLVKTLGHLLGTARLDVERAGGSVVARAPAHAPQ